jgi:hypothetical protein
LERKWKAMAMSDGTTPFERMSEGLQDNGFLDWKSNHLHAEIKVIHVHAVTDCKVMNYNAEYPLVKHMPN